MLDVDQPAIHRAAGLLRAFHQGDEAAFVEILASDYQGDGGGAFRTFCAMLAYTDRAIDWLQHETGLTHEQLLTEKFVPALAEIAAPPDDTNRG